MDYNRRIFLNQASFLAGITILSKPLTSVASVSKRLNSIQSKQDAVTIYHTNDLHGQMDAVYGNTGGILKVKNELSRQEHHGIVLDAGDFLNRSQSFIAQQKVINTMNNMGYHVATPGNHELANGQAHLAKLIPLMQFDLVNCNYTFDQSLNNLIKPYTILNSGKFRIGVTGVGHKLNGVIYNDAIHCANKAAAFLKHTEKCDLVICLSHLGYKQDGDMPDNQKLAQRSENIDMIIGGHNRKLMTGPMVLRNKLNHEVILSQTAWDGLMMGKTVFNFDDGRQKHGLQAKHIFAGQLPGQNFAASYSLLRAKEKAA